MTENRELFFFYHQVLFSLPKTLWSSKNVLMYTRNFMERPLTNLQDLNYNSFAIIKCNAKQNQQKNNVLLISTLLYHINI